MSNRDFLSSSIKLGNLEISPPLFLAPMAENTSYPMRSLALEFGASFVFTEMVTSHPFAIPSKQTLKIIERGKLDYPLGVQICGNEIDLLERCVENANRIGFEMLDFNLGCPVRRMVAKNYGGGLSRFPDQIDKILTMMVKKSNTPVSVKIRSGFDEKHLNAVEIAKIAENAGVSMISVHARTVVQKYAGVANWDVIGQVKDAVSVPVVGNGDIFSGDDARRMYETTGCDGLMVGRGSLGKPWIFAQILDFFKTGVESPRPQRNEIIDIILRHAKMLVEYKGERRAALPLRRYLCQYSKGMDFSHKFKSKCHTLSAVSELEDFLQDFPGRGSQ